MKILWATTFSADMWEASAKHLVDTFAATGTPGDLVAYTEGMDLPKAPNVTGHRFEGDTFLTTFLKKNSDVIPVALGGRAREPLCKCRRGPLGVHDKKHSLPCVGYWFCKNAYRWLRKVRAAQLAYQSHPDHDIMIWVDSDASFLKTVPPEVVASWFAPNLACVYTKSRRKAIETGVVCYHLRNGGRKLIDAMADRYSSGKFRKDSRWDDCVQLERAMNAAKVPTRDVATDVGPRDTVIQFSPLGAYLGHAKGEHRRKGVIT